MTIKLQTKAKPLLPGACIGLLTTGAPISAERFDAGVAALQAYGFRTKCPVDPTAAYGDSRFGFAAASAADRVRGLYELLHDREVSALLAVRGAYGALDILPRLDIEQLRASKKLIIGSSDVTVLLLQAAGRAGLPAIHGTTLGSCFADANSDGGAKESVDALLAMLQRPEYRYETSVHALRDGEGRGPLIAGNLTMLLTLLGTPWDIDYSGAILVIEEVGEAPYRIHRALLQLKLAGKLEKLSGVAFGRFSKCEAKHGPTVDEVLEIAVREIFPSSKYPIVKGLEVGHWGRNLPLPVGCSVEIVGGRFRTLESPLAYGGERDAAQ